MLDTYWNDDSRFELNVSSQKSLSNIFLFFWFRWKVKQKIGSFLENIYKISLTLKQDLENIKWILKSF